jgi:hypothetical protein
MALPTCPQCGADIPVGTETCPTCGRALTAPTTGPRPRRVTRAEAAGFALGIAGLVVFLWMPRLGGLLFVGGVVLFAIGWFRARKEASRVHEC